MSPPDKRRPARGPRRGATVETRAEQRPGLAARKAATRLLGAVIDTRTSLDALTDNEHGHPHYLALDPRDRSLVRAILSAALRHRRALGDVLAKRLDRPLPGNAHALAHILHVALAQILHLDIPDSAAVDLAVTQANEDPRTRRFSGLVNAVLRGVVRNRSEGEADEAGPAGESTDWFRDRLIAAWGADRTAGILAAIATEAAVDFTVKADPERWAETLGGIVLPTGSVRVARPAAPIAELPGYQEGAWWVQDAAAALPARLFGDVAGLQVADLCAAPGGKTAQLAGGGARVTALEIAPGRMRRLDANMRRLGLAAELVQGDLFTYGPDKPFDAVLLDAPCSSTGTVRRHPDVPWTKGPEDVAKLADLQRRMLLRAIDLVRPGGRIVFSNCSLDPSEGEEVVASVLNAEGHRLRLDPVGADEVPGIAPFVTAQGWLRTLPDGLPHADPALAGLDGFFAARLLKTAER